MKKRWLKQGAGVLLTAAMTLGLAGCGKDTGGAVSQDSGLAKQYVYACQDIDMSGMGDSFNVQTGMVKDGRINLVVSVFEYTDSGNDQTVKLLTMNEDGTDVQETDFELPVTESAGGEQGEGGQDTNTGEDSEGAGGDAGAETDTETDTDANDGIMTLPMTRDTEASSYYEYTGYNNFVFADDNTLYGVKTYTYEDYSDPENYVSRNEESVLKWDLEGRLLGEYKLAPVDTNTESVYLNTLVPMGDGTVAALYTGDAAQLCTIDAEGNVSDRTPLPEAASVFQNSSNIMVKGDGELLVTYYDENDYAKMYAATYDLKSNTAGEPGKLPDSFTMSGYNAMMQGLTTDLIYTDNNGVYTLNIGDTESQQMMSFVNSDMNISTMNRVIMLDENRFVGMYSDSINWDSHAGIFTKVAPEDIPDKAVLVLAGNWVGTDVKEKVIEFNKASNEYRIVIKEYNTYNTMDDYDAGVTKLNNDIISGSMPDILMVDTQIPLTNYISKGLLADIGSLIEKDEELSQAAYMENVFEAFSVDGRLYQVIPYFSVMTQIAKTAHVGDRTSWTMKDMEEVMKTMPEGAAPMSDLTRSYFLTMMMQYCGSDFVDVSTGKCDFDSQNFIDMLEFAKTLPAELDDDHYTDDYWQSYESQYREDKTLLMNSYISTVASMNSVINGSFGEPVTFIGFPTESGNGSCVTADQTYALSAKSKNLDGAWEFVRYYLTEEYQNELQWGLPVLTSAFDKKAAEALNKPYYLDENGEKTEYNDTFYMNGESIDLEPMTQEQIDQVVTFIKSVNSPRYYNEDINNIITEEAEAFFSGQKSAQEVAGIIQSRAQIYVSENS